jgi:hypothetical protein
MESKLVLILAATLLAQVNTVCSVHVSQCLITWYISLYSFVYAQIQNYHVFSD